jgi:hypothetical protein
MKRQITTVFEITNWKHEPAKRGHRFRCQGCMKLIADGSDVTIEKRPGGAHGYHSACFKGLNAEAALAIMNGIKRKPVDGTVCTQDEFEGLHRALEGTRKAVVKVDRVGLKHVLRDQAFMLEKLERLQ